MSINSTIRVGSHTDATIDAFSGVMYLEDFEPHVPFATVAFPQTTGDTFQVVNISQFMPIPDLEAFTRFNTWLLLNDSIRVTVTGDTNIHVKGISRAYGVTFKKTVTMQGKLLGQHCRESFEALTPV